MIRLILSSIEKKKIALLCFLFIVLSLIWPSFTCFAKDKIIIAVIYSSLADPYKEALSGFKEQLGQQNLSIDYQQYDCNSNRQEICNRIHQSQPDLIFVLGTEATLLAKKNIKDLPIVFSMIIDPLSHSIIDSLSVPGGNITGVSLDIPVEVQFTKLKEIIPTVKRIGLMYKVGKKEKLLMQAQTAAENMGLQIVAAPIKDTPFVLTGLNEIINKIDCLWAGIDSAVYNSETVKNVFAITIQNKIPFMAYSSKYVEAGAFLSVECDYKEIGRQSALQAMQILNGQKPSVIPIEPPKKFITSLNKKVADLIGIPITGSVRSKIDKIF